MVILVIWSFVKIENRMSKSPTIIINIYIYLIVKKTRVFGIENDQMTMTTLTTFLLLIILFQDGDVYVGFLRVKGGTIDVTEVNAPL